MPKSLGKLKSTKINHINQREMKNIFIAAICLLSTQLQAQTGKVKKTTSYLMPQIALLNGSSGTSTQIQLVGGWVKNNWHFGLGAGIDYYEMRSMPLFSDVRYHFGKEQKIFTYANVGYNFSWVQDTHDPRFIIPPSSNTVKQTDGLYTDIGIGYAIKIGKRNSLLMSTGFSVKQMGEEYHLLPYSSWVWPSSTPWINPESTTVRKFDYTFKRVCFKVAYRLW